MAVVEDALALLNIPQAHTHSFKRGVCTSHAHARDYRFVKAHYNYLCFERALWVYRNGQFWDPLSCRTLAVRQCHSNRIKYPFRLQESGTHS